MEDAGLALTSKAALMRTWLAFERTLMAWVRTAVSLITFGFTLFKAFQWAEEHSALREHSILTPRSLALAMVGLGVVALVLATTQNFWQVRKLKQLRGELPALSIGVLVAVVFIVVGVLAMASMLIESWP